MSILQIILWCLIFLVLMLFSFLFAGFENGVISINKLELESKAKKDKSAAKLLAMVRQPDKVLGTTLLGNNIVNILFASLATYVVDRYIVSFNARYTSLIVGAIVLIFCEVVPKTLFRDYSMYSSSG